MKVLVIDAQGGGVGKALITAIKGELPEIEITAVDSNGAATAAMMKAGADHVATGENAVVVGCRYADVIAGPIGIAVADSMYGEITPKMAVAVGQSMAKRILIPSNTCNNHVVGVSNYQMGQLIKEVVEELKSMV